jgi:hypothetical protein
MDDDRRLRATAPIPSLVRWGLSPDADLLYRVLVTSGPRSVGWLARDLGMPPRRVEAATEELVTAGAVERPGAREKVVRPVPVTDLVAALGMRRQRVTDHGNGLAIVTP